MPEVEELSIKEIKSHKYVDKGVECVISTWKEERRIELVALDYSLQIAREYLVERMQEILLDAFNDHRAYNFRYAVINGEYPITPESDTVTAAIANGTASLRLYIKGRSIRVEQAMVEYAALRPSLKPVRGIKNTAAYMWLTLRLLEHELAKYRKVMI